MKFARILAWVALMFMAMIAVAFIFSGCNVTKHVVTTSTDSATVKKVDSASSSVSELSKNEGSTSTDSGSVQVDFYNLFDTAIAVKDTTPNKNEVTIEPTKDGGYVVTNNTGSKIKSIKIKDAKIIEQHSSNDSTITKVNIVHTSDSSHLVKQVSTKDVSKKTGLSGWMTWFIIIGVALVVVYFIAQSYLKANPLAWLFGFVRKKQEEV